MNQICNMIHLTAVRQHALGLTRASYYYQPAGETAENLELMRLIDKQYTMTPFFGVVQMTNWLRLCGYQVNPKRVRRLMGKMDLVAIFPKPRTSQKSVESKIYPYLLRDLVINRPNQVFSTDITYIPLGRGYLYLVAIMDWYSRYVLSWELSLSVSRLSQRGVHPDKWKVCQRDCKFGFYQFYRVVPGCTELCVSASFYLDPRRW